MAARRVGHKLLDTLGEAEVWILLTREGVLGKVGILHEAEAPPDLGVGWDKHRLGLSYPLHLHPWPELAPLMEVDHKPCCVILCETLVLTS